MLGNNQSRHKQEGKRRIRKREGRKSGESETHKQKDSSEIIYGY